jgi:hypothetical protein
MLIDVEGPEGMLGDPQIDDPIAQDLGEVAYPP